MNETVVVIIGNGFDLNLDLPTSYSDFIESEEFLSLVTGGNYFAKHIVMKKELQNWIDIENELKIYSNRTSYETESGNNFEMDFNSLKIALCNYLQKLQYDKINKGKRAFLMLEFIKQQSNYIILNFNYTNTIDSILRTFGLGDKEINERVVNVHGSVIEDNIIIGVEDGAQIKKEHIFLRKGYNKDYKGIDIATILQKAKRVFIIGHSLGETDHTYFKNWFSTISLPGIKKNNEIIITHYRDKGYKELLTQIDYLTMNNLSSLKMNNKFELIDIENE